MSAFRTRAYLHCLLLSVLLCIYFQICQDPPSENGERLSAGFNADQTRRILLDRSCCLVAQPQSALARFTFNYVDLAHYIDKFLGLDS